MPGNTSWTSNVAPPPQSTGDEYGDYLKNAEIRAGWTDPEPIILTRTVTETRIEIERVEVKVDRNDHPVPPVDMHNPTGWGKGWWER